jgi:3-deoxy-D-manno-octulosonic-acid transferase
MSNRWTYPLFNLLLIAALPLIGVVVLLRWSRRIFSKGSDRWGERWGYLEPATLAKFSTPARWWWVHAVSMGEVKAIESFLRQVPASTGARVVLSAVTPEALAWAETHHVADVIIAAPLDLPWVVRRTLRVIRPEMFISVESEFWPNLLRESKLAGAKVALINGRISVRSFQSYGRIRPLLSALWDTLDLFAVRQPEDAERFVALGVPAEKIRVTGNLKYDLFTERRSHKRHSGEAPVVVLGSTREGEEDKLLPTIERVRAQIPQMKVIFAPRHIERVSEIEDLLKANGLSSQRISAVRQNGEGASENTPYVLWDSMGDLLDAYREADVAVIGGSFVPKGGQNPIEPAALHLPVLFGPSMDNFKGVAENLVRAGGARRVSTEELEGHLAALLKNPDVRKEMGEKAHLAVISEQGATDRTLILLKDLLHA